MSQEKNIISYGYINEKDEQDLLKLSAANNIEARRKGAFLGKQDRPSLNETSFESLIAPFITNYEEHRAKRIGNIKPEVHESKFKRFCEELGKRTSIIKEKLISLRHENDLDKHNLEGKPKPEVKKRNPLFLALLCVMYLAEFFLNALAFEFLGGNPILAYCIGAGVTILFGVLCFSIGKNIARMETEDRKPYMQLGILIATTLGLAIAMSIIRAKMLADNTEVPLSPWIFFCINIAFLVGTVFFFRLFFPSQKETDANRELIKRHEIIEKRDCEITQLEEELKKMAEELKKEEEEYAVVMSTVRHLCERIDAHYRETVALFKAENILARPDKGTPACFLAPIPELKPINPPNTPQS